MELGHTGVRGYSCGAQRRLDSVRLSGKQLECCNATYSW
jgi:hypothetical protein